MLIKLKILSYNLAGKLDHPPLSPDLAPCDNHVFLDVKKHFGDQCHNDDNSIKKVMLRWLLNQAADFCYHSIQNLVAQSK